MMIVGSSRVVHVVINWVGRKTRDKRGGEQTKSVPGQSRAVLHPTLWGLITKTSKCSPCEQTPGGSNLKMCVVKSNTCTRCVEWVGVGLEADGNISLVGVAIKSSKPRIACVWEGGEGGGIEGKSLKGLSSKEQSRKKRDAVCVMKCEVGVWIFTRVLYWYVLYWYVCRVIHIFDVNKC